MYKYPCSHVLAVCQEIAVHFSDFVDDAYTITAYMNAWSGDFNPLPHEDYWMHTRMFKCMPDHHRLRPKQKGRPKSTRLRNEMDDRQIRNKNHCDICREQGHDRRRCPRIFQHTSTSSSGRN